MDSSNDDVDDGKVEDEKGLQEFYLITKSKQMMMRQKVRYLTFLQVS